MLKWLSWGLLALAVLGPCSVGGAAAPDGAPPEAAPNSYIAYRSFWPELEMTATFGEMGIDTRCFFAANTINSMGFEYCKYPPIWLGIGRYDFEAYDQQVKDLVTANPNVRFLCMIDLNTPPWLTRKLAVDSFDAISHAASDPKWLEYTTTWLEDFIAYSEEHYGDRIDAYILSGGGTSEWYEYDRGRSSRVKSTAWRAWSAAEGLDLGPDVPGESTLREAAHDNVIYDPATEMDKIQYWRFHNHIVAEAILHFAKTARSLLDDRKEVGVFYGYYLVSDQKLVSFGHLDYERVFASPDIDFFISPGTYNDRATGGGSGPQLVRGTVQRYGKRYLHEIDHRTHVLPQGNQWKTQQEDEAGLTREAAFAVVNDASYWWFDMLGGWYEAEPTRDLIRRLHAFALRHIDRPSTSVAETLLVADPQSAVYVNDKAPHAAAMTRKFRERLSKTGAPFDLYSFNDLAVIDLSPYKVICLPATLLISPERAALLREKVLNNNRTIIWNYAPGISDGESLDTNRVKAWTGTDYGIKGPTTVAMDGWTSIYSWEYGTMSPEALRAIQQAAGVHLYVDETTPVYANDRLLVIHSKTGGPKQITLPRPARRITNALTGERIAENTATFTHPFETPDTLVFELDGD